MGWTWWYTAIIAALRRLRQEDPELTMHSETLSKKQTNPRYGTVYKMKNKDQMNISTITCFFLLLSLQ
jgi:hypothetical protein